MKRKYWFVPAIAVTLGILALSTFLAAPIQVEGVNHLDKWQHTFAYFVLSFSFLFAFKKNEMLSRKTSLLVLLLSGFYGLLLELAQYQFFENRFFDLADAIANVLGSVLGFLLFSLVSKKISA